LPDDTAWSAAASVSSNGVSSSQTWICHRSMWSTCSRRSEPSSAFSSAPRDAPDPNGPSLRLAAALVAITLSSRGTTPPSRSPRIRSPSPSQYTSAVSTNVPPASTKATSRLAASSASAASPQLIVPRPIRDTRRPDPPSRRCRMLAAYASGDPIARPPCRRRRERAIESVPVRSGLTLGHWSGADATPAAAPPKLDLATEAERLGYSAVWVAEAYGSDAATVLGYLAARTTTIDLGAAVFQIPARTPAMTAMTAATLDILSNGRFRLGLGVSGPVVSEGWHGVRFDAPLARTREYVEIVRQALRREKLHHQGKHYPLPLPDGPGKPLHLQGDPPSEHLPVYRASIGPRNLELTGAIADGWLGIFFSPEHADDQLRHVRAGAEGAQRSLADIDIAPSVPLVVGDDWRECADAVRDNAA